LRTTDTKRLLLSLFSGVFLTVFLYILSFVLSRFEGIVQAVGAVLAALLAFPLFLFFHDQEPPIALLIAVGLFDVCVLSLPAFILLTARRS
jgi:hypothetical protein